MRRRVASCWWVAVPAVILTLSGCRKEQPADAPDAPAEPAPPVAAAAAKRASSVIFADLTEEVGLDFFHFIGGTGKFYFPEIMGSGCAVFDYDADGDLDIYALQGTLLNPAETLEDAVFPFKGQGQPRNRLFRNELETGRLHFVDVTAEAGVGHTGYGMGCTVGDYDNDGDSDLYITNYGPNVLYRNNGDGTFTDITAEAGVEDTRWSCSAAFADFDSDGRLDLYVANYVDWRLEIDRACYSSTGVRDYCSPVTYRPTVDSLFMQRADGTFQDATADSGIAIGKGNGLGVVCADFNGDERIDIYVANDGVPNFLWMNRGVPEGGSVPKFRDQALLAGAAVNEGGMAEAGMGVTTQDFDGDGDLDIYVNHLKDESSTLYLNNGRGIFHDATIAFSLAVESKGFTGFGTCWFDYDHDGLLDLYSANGAVYYLDALAGDPYPYHQPNVLFRHLPDGKFEDVSEQAGPHFKLSEDSRGAAFGDIDNDGDMDIVVLNQNNGPLRLLRNEVGNRANWLLVRLIGTDCNRSAIGARIVLHTPDGRLLRRRVHVDGSYCSSNDLRVHFGLGEFASAGDAVVHWPNGRVEKWAGLPVNSQVELVEGQGEISP